MPSTLVTDWGVPIEYKEHTPSQDFSYTGKKLSSTRTFTELAWSDHYAFAATMVGYSELVTQGGTTYVHRVVPRPHPLRHYGKPVLYARDVVSVTGIRPIGTQASPGGDRYGYYDTAEVTIGYDTVSYKILADSLVLNTTTFLPDESLLKRYITRTFAPAGEYFQLPRGAHRWASDGQPANQTLGRSISRVDLSYIWHEVPGLPTAIFSAIGKVNSTAFDGYGVQTLQLLAVEAVPYKSVVGTTVYDISFRMRRVLGDQPSHNYFLRFKGSTAAAVWDVPNTGLIVSPQLVFETIDFHTLFRAPFGAV